MPMVTANGGVPDTQNPFQQSSDLMGQAGGIYGGIAEGGILQNINSYMQPYHEQVLNAALGRMGNNYELGMDRLGDTAEASSAFGGSRHGVAEGVMTGQYNQNVGDLTANVNAAAYNQATGIAQQDIQNQFGAAQGITGLAGNYYNIGNNIADRQMQAGNQQQDLWQSILDGGQEQWGDMLNSPYKMMELFQAMTASDPRNNAGSTTQQSTPGIYDWLSMMMQAVPGI